LGFQNLESQKPSKSESNTIIINKESTDAECFKLILNANPKTKADRFLKPVSFNPQRLEFGISKFGILFIFSEFSKLPKTKKTSSKEEVFVPGAGVEPARFPTGV
jgi:hypothetical protein